MIAPLFLAHGSPLMAIEDTAAARFLAGLGQRIRPKGIVVFTAHWESETLTISSPEEAFETIHDFSGFPSELYAVKYPAKGSPELAAKAEELLRLSGFAVKRSNRGLDHGAWVPLSHMYPQADIPVVQISVNPYLPAETQFRIGAALRKLAQEDMLVIGSGATVHNLYQIQWELPRNREPEAWASAFDDWLIDKLQSKSWDAVFRYDKLAPYARQAVPRPEHFVPLLLAAGSGDPGSRAEVIHRSYEFGILSYLSIQF